MQKDFHFSIISVQDRSKLCKKFINCQQDEIASINIKMELLTNNHERIQHNGGCKTINILQLH